MEKDRIVYPRYLGRESLMITIDRLPPSAVKAVIVNNEARDMLPREHHSLLNPDLLTSMATMTTLRDYEIENQRSVCTMYDECRSLPVMEFTKPITYHDGIMASYVTVKGTHVSGLKHANAHMESRVRRPSSQPEGFFGDSDCAEDISNTNALLASGMKCSLDLGYLILDARRVKEFLRESWEKNDFDFSTIEYNLEKVGENKDVVAMIVRLNGTRFRLENNVHKTMVPESASEVQFRRGAAYLFSESFTRKRFEEYSENGDISIERIQEVLKTIAYPHQRHNKFLSPKEASYAVRAIYAMAYTEVLGLALATQERKFRLSLYNYPGNSQGKDIDSSMMFYDFEGDGFNDGATDNEEKINHLAVRSASLVEAIVRDYIKHMLALDMFPSGKPQQPSALVTSAKIKSELIAASPEELSGVEVK